MTKSCGAVEPPGPVQTKVKVVGLVIGGETSPAKLEGGFEPVQPPEAVHGVGPDVLVEVQVRLQASPLVTPSGPSLPSHFKLTVGGQ